MSIAQQSANAWRPSDVIALIAVVASIVGILVSQSTQIFLASRNHKRSLLAQQEKERADHASDRLRRSNDAAGQLLMAADRMTNLRGESRGTGPSQDDLEESYREFRRLIPLISDAEARTQLERVATVFYQWDAATELLGAQGSWHYVSHHASEYARSVLGAILRGEELPGEPNEFRGIWEAQDEVWSWRIQDLAIEENLRKS